MYCESGFFSGKANDPAQGVLVPGGLIELVNQTFSCCRA